MSRFHEWTLKVRAVLGAATQIEREPRDLRELADGLERQGLDGAVSALRAAAALLEQAHGDLAADLERIKLTPASREVEFWKAGGQ